MAVIVKYIVVRNGVEKMTFTTKKEADAYDKMLDIADNLYEFIELAELNINESVLEDLSLFLAKNNEKVLSLLRGAKLKPEPKQAETKKIETKKPETKKTDTEKKEPEKKKASTKKAAIAADSKLTAS